MIDHKKIKKRFSGLETERDKWLPYWKDIKTYINPWRGAFDVDPNQPERSDGKICDLTTLHCCTVLAAGMQGGLTPRSRPWFRLMVADPELSAYDPVRYYLNDVQEAMYNVLSKSNAYNGFHSTYAELGPFGSAAMLVEEDYQHGIRCQTFTAGEFMLASSAQGLANTFARKFHMTALQLVEQFGLDNVSHTVRRCYQENNTEQWFTVYHLIEPNDDRIPDCKDAKNKPFRSLYWQDGTEEGKFLRVSGYDEFPVMAPRWDVVAANIYGIGPGWHALSDSKMLQELQKDKLIAVKKVTSPPIKTTASVYNRNIPNINPKGITVVDDPSQAGIAPLFQINPDLSGLQLVIGDTQQSLRQCFFYDLFLMFAGDDRNNVTATEIARKNEEKLLVLGPVLERLEHEFLNPMIDRVYSIMQRNGVLPPPPEEIQGLELKVEYTSILAQAQKMVGITGIEQVAGFVGNLVAVFSDVADKFNASVAVEKYADMVGLPPGIVRSAEEVAKIQQARQQQAEAEQAAQMAMQAAEGAKILSETDMGGNNALTQLMGGMGP